MLDEVIKFPIRKTIEGTNYYIDGSEAVYLDYD